MSTSSTPRFGLKQWSADSDPAVTRADLNGITGQLESLAALDLQGLASARPAPGVRGRYFRATDTLVLYRDDGTTWHEVAESDASGGRIVRRSVPDGSKYPTDAPSTYPLGHSTMVAANVDRPEWSTSIGQTANWLIETNRSVYTGYTVQTAYRSSSTNPGLTYRRMSSLVTSDTWTVWTLIGGGGTGSAALGVVSEGPATVSSVASGTSNAVVVSRTVAVVAGRRYRALGRVLLFNDSSVNTATHAARIVNPDTTAQVFLKAVVVPVSSTVIASGPMFTYVPASSGSATFQLQVSNTGSGGTCKISSPSDCWLSVEDLGASTTDAQIG